MPSHYKIYKVEKQENMVTKPTRTLTTLGVSYDGLEDTKRIDVVSPSKESKLVHISIDLCPQEESKLIQLLLEFKDVFAWSYKDLKGVYWTIYQHIISL